MLGSAWLTRIRAAVRPAVREAAGKSRAGTSSAATRVDRGAGDVHRHVHAQHRRRQPQHAVAHQAQVVLPDRPDGEAPEARKDDQVLGDDRAREPDGELHAGHRDNRRQRVALRVAEQHGGARRVVRQPTKRRAPAPTGFVTLVAAVASTVAIGAKTRFLALVECGPHGRMRGFERALCGSAPFRWNDRQPRQGEETDVSMTPPSAPTMSAACSARWRCARRGPTARRAPSRRPIRARSRTSTCGARSASSARSASRP